MPRKIKRKHFKICKLWFSNKKHLHQHQKKSFRLLKWKKKGSTATFIRSPMIIIRLGRKGETQKDCCGFALGPLAWQINCWSEQAADWFTRCGMRLSKSAFLHLLMTHWGESTWEPLFPKSVTNNVQKRIKCPVSQPKGLSFDKRTKDITLTLTVPLAYNTKKQQFQRV